MKDCDFVESPLAGDLPEDLNVSGVAYDSRTVGERYIFVAIKGERFDGHSFIRNAIIQGACAVVHEEDVDRG
ncbi:MAG TPA: Mur ligase domain-containing protein, partial [Thermodesulfovibrionales bacterium]|nr:Mur ligase domain-containing protein [Thermodesulfovibrionales bacterium]